MSSAADIFEAQRPLLIALAYRMLGERAMAEDVVQESWLRWDKADRTQIDQPAGWLRQVCTRLAIDQLRSARARRETYVGPWLPEALLEETAPAAEDAYVLARECELALLWAMERLAPEERSAFILRTAFDIGYDEIAATLGKSPTACRQLVSRAQKRVKDGAPRYTPASGEVEATLAQFAGALAAGDQESVLNLLAPDALAFTDGGGRATAAGRPLRGAVDIARALIGIARKFGEGLAPQLVRVNGRPALMHRQHDEQDVLISLTTDADGKISWIYIMRNPHKLPG